MKITDFKIERSGSSKWKVRDQAGTVLVDGVSRPEAELSRANDAMHQGLSDDSNPYFETQGLSTESLLAIVHGEVDPVALARAHLASRGFDENGRWIGFAMAEKIWFKG